MASFFPPSNLDLASEQCGQSTYAIYCNRIGTLQFRSQPWYRLATFGLGAGALLAPVLLWIFLKGRVYACSIKQAGTRPSSSSRRLHKSIRLTPHSSSFSLPLQEPYDITVLPFTISKPSPPHDNGIASQPPIPSVGESGTATPNNGRIGCFDMEALNRVAVRDGNLLLVTDRLAATFTQWDLACLALRCTHESHHEVMEKLVEQMTLRKLPILLLAHHDWPNWESISLSKLSGAIVENACILPCGKRRDYFHAKPLRHIMAGCTSARERNPGFFIGFLEIWEKRPDPSVIRRAVKLAEHCGAAVAHGPPDMSPGVEGFPIAATSTLSAFESLKQPDIVKNCWALQARKVWIPNGQQEPRVASFGIEHLESVIPEASHLLSYESLPPSSAQLRADVPTLASPPIYYALAPNSGEFWNVSWSGTRLSELGCFPTCAAPVSEDFVAVVETQQHLRELNMLQLVDSTEALAMVEAYKSLTTLQDCSPMVLELVNGLESRQISVFRGLDSGFRGSDAHARFWGVSQSKEGAGGLYIFVSQKAPSMLAAVLHTWLAHLGLPRNLRFDYEVLLEVSTGLGTEDGLPLSIKSGIEMATPSEVLTLLQQLHVADLDSPLRNTMISFCRKVLIDDVSLSQRMQMYSKGLLDGSMTIRQALEARCRDLVELGATELPSVNKLQALYHRTEEAVCDALIFGSRKCLASLALPLFTSFEPDSSTAQFEYIDIRTDLFALIFFSVLRRAAFEEVYIEVTDRCPLLLQPDQAAVFAELWVLGSKCDAYFGLLPRDLGEIVHNRYRASLQQSPPSASDRTDGQTMTMYSTFESAPIADDGKSKLHKSQIMHERINNWRAALSGLGGLSIFCLPAIVDATLLSFLGRGMFMTAFMPQNHLSACVIALLLSLLLSAGIVGWVGSIGSYYLPNYAYDNMIHFHVQRLSGGCIIIFSLAVCGLIAYTIVDSIATGFVFFGYLIAIATYLNLLGILATMHQTNSPITSGRTVILRNIPQLLLSPILTTFVNGYDTEIYLAVMYSFLLLLILQYRRLCHEWSGWMANMQDFSEEDVVTWYAANNSLAAEASGQPDKHKRDAQEALREAVAAHSMRTHDSVSAQPTTDDFVSSVARSVPYIDWLFKRTAPHGNLPPQFSTGWFTQLGEAKTQQRQVARGLKEHNIFILYRMARYDIGLNLGLFLIVLMDRWVDAIMTARLPHPILYSDASTRYGLCFCTMYYCLSAMVLDMVLYEYWHLHYTRSSEPLRDHNHAKTVAKAWADMGREAYMRGLSTLFARISAIFGVSTLLLWVFVEDSVVTVSTYYMYVLGYTCVILFQFNRCFTKNLHTHLTILFASAFAGLTLGCTLRACPSTAGWVYSEVLAQNCAALLAAFGTSILCWWGFPIAALSAEPRARGKSCAHRYFRAQRKLSAPTESDSLYPLAKAQNLKGIVVSPGSGMDTAMGIEYQLYQSLADQNKTLKETPWSVELIETAIFMWQARRAKVVFVQREDFSSAGLSHMCSVSNVDDDGGLTVKVGIFGEAELQSRSWRDVLVVVATESLLHHVSRAMFSLSYAEAVRAEHLVAGDRMLSKRLEMELALGDRRTIRKVARRATSELLSQLCWDVDVNSKWQTLPRCAREAIFCRIAGKSVAITDEIQQWLSNENVDVDAIEFSLQLTLSVLHFCSSLELSPCYFSEGPSDVSDLPAQLKPAQIHNSRENKSLVWRFVGRLIAAPQSIVKWIAIISGGSTGVERELEYSLRQMPGKYFILRAVLLLWRACRRMKDFWVRMLLVRGHAARRNIARLVRKGERRELRKNIIAIDRPRESITAFMAKHESGGSHTILEAFSGCLQSRPQDKKSLFKAVYDEHSRLLVREDGDGITSAFTYDDIDYPRWPLCKEVVGGNRQMVGLYDMHGRIANGTLALGSIFKLEFDFIYKATPLGSTDIIRANYKPCKGSESNDQLSIFWAAPPPPGSAKDDCDWVPSDKAYRIVRVINGRVFVTEIEYRHRRDPMRTTIREEASGLATAIAEEPRVFFEDDSLYEKPHNMTFDSDDLLIHHSRRQVKMMQQDAGNKTPPVTVRFNPFHLWKREIYISLPTWRIRTELWDQWLKGKLDAATACWMDELILRKEPLLRRYWRAREMGHFEEAKMALDKGIGQITSAIDPETGVSELCLLPIRTADLYAMGLGKDATEVTSRPQDCYQDTKNRVSVIINDTGCWPEAPGGVSNCRRDLVNGHSTIRNHVLAECANDFGIPRFQVEKSVQSMKLLPLWGLDGRSAYHGLISNILQSQVDEKIGDTDREQDVVGIFIPLLRAFVKGARTKSYSREALIKQTNVILSISRYYQLKDYNFTWDCSEVEAAWADAWLVPYNDPNIKEAADSLEIERPSFSDFKDALGIYMAYFFIFSVGIPDDCPRVFQSTHHGISSLFGMVLKYTRGVTFGIWDHAILWRENCLNISPAQCELSVPVQSMLLGGMRLASRLAYFHADVVVPCTSLFNPYVAMSLACCVSIQLISIYSMWETEIGTDQGTLCHRNEFQRKIDPIVNGISNMNAFTPIETPSTDKPTAVMLSNIQSIKGIKIAILAADVIVNRYGFQDYRLVVYGAKNRQPAYTIEMDRLIAKCNLSENVSLAGFGKPSEVLKKGWIFVNSSISEGLPLAIGEAALAGVPIVATEVGATALVITDPDNPHQRYGEVVSPNDPVALARAQLSLLCMVGQWAKFTGDEAWRNVGELPEEIKPEDVKRLSKRMYEKADGRRSLGLLSREVVLRIFHGRRYLREHEQMFWIQWHMAKIRAGIQRKALDGVWQQFGSNKTLIYAEASGEFPHEEEVEAMELAEAITGRLDPESQMMQMAIQRRWMSRLLSSPSATQVGSNSTGFSSFLGCGPYY